MNKSMSWFYSCLLLSLWLLAACGGNNDAPPPPPTQMTLVFHVIAETSVPTETADLSIDLGTPVPVPDTSSEGIAMGQPDLIITGVEQQYLDSDNCDPDAPTGVLITIKNIGTFDAGLFSLFINGPTIDITSLEVGEEESVFMPNATVGNPTNLEIDFKNIVIELDEGNNTFTDPVSAPRLPAACGTPVPESATRSSAQTVPTRRPTIALPVSTPTPEPIVALREIDLAVGFVRSPDEDWVAFASNGRLYIATPKDSYTPDLNTAIELVELPTPDTISQLVWSPSGDQIIYTQAWENPALAERDLFIPGSTRHALWSIEPKENAEPIQLTTLEDELEWHSATVSPDGTYIALRGGNNFGDACFVGTNFGIMALGNNSEPTEITFQTNIDGFPSASGNGGMIYPLFAPDLMWLSDDELQVSLAETCVEDSENNGVYVVDVTSLNMEKTADLPPAPNDPTTWAELETYLTTLYSNQFNNTNPIQRTLETLGWLSTNGNNNPLVASAFHTADLNGDGKVEWVLTLTDITADIEAWVVNKPSRLWVISDGGLVYEIDNSDDRFYSAPQITSVDDFTGDGIFDLVTNEESCGSSSCFGNFRVISTHNLEWQNVVRPSGLDVPETFGNVISMTYSDTSTSDVTEDGINDFVIVGGAIGSTGAGVHRTRKETWAWNGQYIDLAQVEWLPSDYRHHQLYNAIDYVRAGDLASARDRYNAVISDGTLRNSPPLNDQDSDPSNEIRMLAAFALSAFALDDDNLAEAQSWQTRVNEFASNESPIPAALASMLSRWEQSGNIENACAGAAAALWQENEYFLETFFFGLENPDIGPLDVCPFTPSLRTGDEPIIDVASVSRNGRYIARSLLRNQFLGDIQLGYKTQLAITNFDGTGGYLVEDYFQNTGLGTQQPTVLQWTDDSLYYTLRATPDGGSPCASYRTFNNSVNRLNLQTGIVLRNDTLNGPIVASPQDNWFGGIGEDGVFTAFHPIDYAPRSIDLNLPNSLDSQLAASPDGTKLLVSSFVTPCDRNSTRFILVDLSGDQLTSELVLDGNFQGLMLISWNADKFAQLEDNTGDRWLLDVATGELSQP